LRLPDNPLPPFVNFDLKLTRFDTMFVPFDGRCFSFCLLTPLCLQVLSTLISFFLSCSHSSVVYLGLWRASGLSGDFTPLCYTVFFFPVTCPFFCVSVSFWSPLVPFFEGNTLTGIPFPFFPEEDRTHPGVSLSISFTVVYFWCFFLSVTFW